MKKYIFPIIIILVVSLIVSGCTNKNADSTNSNKILAVNDIKADPSSFTGTITIDAVMTNLTSSSDKTMFGIIDKSEALACKTVSCSNFVLPVKYDGKLPQAGDEINVTGSFVGSGNNIMFQATSLKILGNLLPNGGQ